MGVSLTIGSLGVWMAPFQIGALMDGLKFSASQSGLIGTVEIAAMSLTAILVTRLLTKWSCSQIAIFGALFAAVCQLVSAFVDDLTVLSGLRLLVGIGCGLIFGSMCASAARSDNPDSDFAWAQALMNVIYFVLFVITPYVLIYGQYRGLFVSYAVLTVLAIPFFRLLSPGVKGEEQAQNIEIPKENRVLIVLNICAAAIFSMAVGALWGYIERMGVDNVGLSITEIGLLLSISVIFMFAGSVVAGALGLRFGRAVPLVVASMACGVAVLMAAITESYWVYASGLMLYSFWYLFITPYIIAGTSSELDPSGRLASAMGGIMFLFYSIGIGVGGFVVEHSSLSAIGWFGLLLCAVSAALFLVISIRAKPTSRIDGLLKP